MNKRYLFSIILSIAFLISPVTYADTISTPSYQVDVTHQVVDVGKSDVVAAVNATGTMQSLSQIKSTSLSKSYSPTLIMACDYGSAKNANALGVPEGDSIGIGRPI